MESAILVSQTKGDLNILLNLARKLGINVTKLSEEEALDLGLVWAMKKGRTGEYIENKEYLKKLRSK